MPLAAPRPAAARRRGRVLAALVAATALAGCAGTRAPSGSTSPASTRDAEPVSAALARATFDSAWRSIAAQHYDPSLRGVDWGAVRAELAPRAEGASTLGELRAVLRDLATRPGESHFGLLPSERGAPADRRAGGTVPGDVGLTLRVLDGALVVARVEPDGPGARAGVRPGWTVTRVGEREMAAELRAVHRGPATERRTATVRVALAAARELTGPAGSRMAVRFRDTEGRALDLALVRRETPGTLAAYGNLGAVIGQVAHERVSAPGGGCLGVVRFDVWLPALLPAIDTAMTAVRDCRGLVLDLRGNVGGVGGMALAVGAHLVREPTALGVLRMRDAQFRFVAEPRRVTATGAPAAPFGGPVALLVDGHSASTTEFFAAGLQEAGRARVFGEPTAGQALPAAMLRLPTGDVLMHVVADFHTPGGTRIEGHGVRPDESVPLRRADLLAGRDAPRAAALAWLARASAAGSISATGSRAAPVPHP